MPWLKGTCSDDREEASVVSRDSRPAGTRVSKGVQAESVPSRGAGAEGAMTCLPPPASTHLLLQLIQSSVLSQLRLQQALSCWLSTCCSLTLVLIIWSHAEREQQNTAAAD